MGPKRRDNSTIINKEEKKKIYNERKEKKNERINTSTPFLLKSWSLGIS